MQQFYEHTLNHYSDKPNMSEVTGDTDPTIADMTTQFGLGSPLSGGQCNTVYGVVLYAVSAY